MKCVPVLLIALTAAAAERPRIDLNGAWEFRTEGGTARSIQVPGAWQAQGVGEPSGILRNHYVGKAWYRRSVAIPGAWKGKTVFLRVGGVVRRAAVSVNGVRVGEHDGCSAPFSFEISSALRPGAENQIEFLVENPGTTITDAPHDQKSTEPTGMFTYIGNWGGIYGSVALEAVEPEHIESVVIVPDVRRKQAQFQVAVKGASGRIEVEAAGAKGSADVSAGEVVLQLADAELWSPERPTLYTATIRLIQDGRERDRIQERFGLREITTEGNALLLNGKPLYLRGFGDDNIEVLTGVPPASRQVHFDRLRLAKSYGFNAVRFHSMTPGREYFEAADEVGILVMAELPASYTMHFLPHKAYLKAELERVLRAYRNHPSFLSLAFGNEFNLDWLKTEAERKDFQATVSEFYRFAKSIDPRRLILSNDGLMLRPTDMASLFRDAPADIPAVRHEFGSYYCSLPDPSLIPKFTGVIVPTWLERKQEWVERSGFAEAYPTYVRNSQRLQTLGQKYQIEKARLLPEFTGYHYWLIVDFPGGTGEGDSWEEGWFDYFWTPKTTTPEQGRELNSPVLLMIGAGVNDRTLWSGARKRIEVTVSNYGDSESGVLTWKIGGQTGQTKVSAPRGKVTRIGEITVGPVQAEAAQKVELAIEFATGAARYANRWDFWVFPREALSKSAPIPVTSRVKWDGVRRLYPFIGDAGPSGLLITPELDAEATAFLDAGGRVWLMAGREYFERNGDATFFPASGGAQGTVLRDHPALRGFPHEGFCDLQFFSLLDGAWNFPLDGWPKELVPIAGAVRTTSSFLSKQKNLSKTGYIFEARAGKGSLLVTTLRLREHLDEAYPEAIWLFDRLLRYATGPEFKPQVTSPPSLRRR
jgi:hypothetical protein